MYIKALEAVYMEEQQSPQQLIKRYLDGTATPAEKAIVDSWHLADLSQSDITPSENEIAQVHANMRQQLSNALPMRKPMRLWPPIAVAASIFLVLSIATYFILQYNSRPNQITQAPIVPGGKKAILTLANGQQIDLNDAQAGTIAQQGQVQISKVANGQIVYAGSNASKEVAYNTVATPRGGFYSLKLADGTLAVLDAESSIKYPVAFTGPERRVEITGQVYFEVVHNAKQPFRVRVKDETIEDLGTEFNIKAYDDEPVMKTTLVTGIVKVSNKSHSVLLKPGQQASGQVGTSLIDVKAVNTSYAVAWKNGYASFENEDITAIMRQVSRWYDVDIVYEGAMPATKYAGGISRSAQLKDVLKILAFNDVNFSVIGRTIHVKP